MDRFCCIYIEVWCTMVLHRFLRTARTVSFIYYNIPTVDLQAGSFREEGHTTLLYNQFVTSIYVYDGVHWPSTNSGQINYLACKVYCTQLQEFKYVLVCPFWSCLGSSFLANVCKHPGALSLWSA